MWHHHTQVNFKMVVVNFIILVQKMSQNIWSNGLTGSNRLRIETSHLTTCTRHLPLQHGFSPKSMLLALIPWFQTEKVYQKISRKWLRGKSLRQNPIGRAQIISSSVHMSSVHQRRKRRTWWSFSPTGPFLALQMMMSRTKLKSYDFTNGGTDIVDQRMGFYTIKFKSRKWPMKAFVNASTLFVINNTKDPSKQDSFVFGMSVVFGPVGSFIQQRNQWRLNSCVLAKIA